MSSHCFHCVLQMISFALNQFQHRAIFSFFIFFHSPSVWMVCTFWWTLCFLWWILVFMIDLVNDMSSSWSVLLLAVCSEEAARDLRKGFSIIHHWCLSWPLGLFKLPSSFCFPERNKLLIWQLLTFVLFFWWSCLVFYSLKMGWFTMRAPSPHVSATELAQTF